MSLKLGISHAMGGFSLDVAIDAPTGITALFGPSGAGKSTLINAVAGLLRPQSGRIVLNDTVLCDSAAGVHLPPHKRRIGYVFQNARLFPHLSVAGNLGYGRWFSRKRRGRGHEPDFDHVVAMLGLGSLLDRRPGALSGGEAQRVALGRALLGRPELILADEPLAALDEARKQEILPYFERLRDEMSIPMLYVSHAPAEVARLANKVVAIKAGRVTHQGPADEVLADPEVLPVGIRGVGAVIAAQVVMHHDDGLTELDTGGVRLFLPAVPAEPGRRLRLRIPAQDVTVSLDRPAGISALNVLPGTVSQVRLGAGPGAVVSIDTAAGPILARVTRRSVTQLGLAKGTACHAIVKSLSIAPGDVGG